MLRRGFLKLLGAAIAVPWIGWPIRRVRRRLGWYVVGLDLGASSDTAVVSYSRCDSEGIWHRLDSTFGKQGRS